MELQTWLASGMELQSSCAQKNLEPCIRIVTGMLKFNKWHCEKKQDSPWCFWRCVWGHKVTEVLSTTSRPVYQAQARNHHRNLRFLTLCPTCWTVHTASSKSVIDKYMVFQALWDEVKDAVTDSEVRARVIIGVDAISWLDWCWLKSFYSTQTTSAKHFNHHLWQHQKASK